MAGEPSENAPGNRGIIPGGESEIHSVNSPETIPVEPVFAYNRGEVHSGEAPGGLAARYEIRIATGLEGEQVAARQAEAVAGLLEWARQQRRNTRSRSSAMTAAAQDMQPVPFAFVGRTSTMELQDPVASLRKQVRQCQAKLPPGGFFAAYFWDIESGGLDLDARGHGSAHELFPDIGIPRDGGIADLLAEAAAPSHRFVAVVCQNIERSARDMLAALQLEKRLQHAEIPLFASDEPISMDRVTASAVLLRRTKQAIAEFFRLNIKEDARLGFEQHTIDGWNIGPVPHGYQGEKHRHPNPLKASQGKTKTRLVLDPPRVPAVEMIFYWRTVDKVGGRTIMTRLNADPGQYPPVDPAGWTEDDVYRILHNPKYTGYQVYGRRRKVNGKVRPVPRDQWIWSPQPAHPAIVSRDTWEAAQAIGAEHRTSRDGTDPNTHPATRRSYLFRSRCRCADCQHRMSGNAPRPEAVYYVCPHNPANPKHVQAYPHHPHRVAVRQDHLTALVHEFCEDHLFSPTGRQALAKAIPTAATRQAGQRDKQAARLRQRLAKIDAEQTAYAKELTALATGYSDDNPAVTALRNRNLELFTALETEKTTITQELGTLTSQATPSQDPTLLDELPTLTAGTLTTAPTPQLAQLYQALSLQLTYNHTARHLTIQATLTGTTPAELTTWHTTLTTIPPATPHNPDPRNHLPVRPIVCTPSHSSRWAICGIVYRCGRRGLRAGRRVGGRPARLRTSSPAVTGVAQTRHAMRGQPRPARGDGDTPSLG
jgi:site-specific DNA recombinase